MSIITLHPHGPIEVRRTITGEIDGLPVSVDRAYVLMPLQPTVIGEDGNVVYEPTDISAEPEDVRQAAANHWTPERVETFLQLALAGD